MTLAADVAVSSFAPAEGVDADALLIGLVISAVSSPRVQPWAICCRFQVRVDAVVLEAFRVQSLAACICGEPVRRGPICVVRYSRFFISSE